MIANASIQNIIMIANINMKIVFHFVRFFIRHFHESHGLQIATALSYTTLLSIVPLVVVAFSLFGQVPILQELSGLVQDYIFANFVPQLGDTIHQYIDQFSSNAGQLTISGIIALLIVALMLIATIDNAFNQIWLVKNKRSLMSRILVYWAILTMGPILLGLGLASTSYILSLNFIEHGGLNGFHTTLIAWMPFFNTLIGLTIIYILVPNCFVKISHALLSAVICTSLLEFAKFGFGFYIEAASVYETIYGALFILPLFLIWLYLLWIIILMGAHISFCLSAFSVEDEKNYRHHKVWHYLDALEIIAILNDAQKQGTTLTINMVRQKLNYLPHHDLVDIFDLLKQKRWVNLTVSGQWLLARDLNATSLYDLYMALPARLPILTNEAKDHSQLHDRLVTIIGSHQENLKKCFAISIEDFFTRS